MFEEKNNFLNEIFDYNIVIVEEQISRIQNDESPFRQRYDKYSQKRIQLLNEIINNWRKIKILFSNSELDKAEILMSYNKLLSKYESELSLALSEVVYKDTNTLVKTDKGIKSPIKVDDTLVDQAGYAVDEFTSPRANIKPYIDYKYDKICEKYENAINELQVAQNNEKQSGRSF